MADGAVHRLEKAVCLLGGERNAIHVAAQRAGEVGHADDGVIWHGGPRLAKPVHLKHGPAVTHHLNGLADLHGHPFASKTALGRMVRQTAETCKLTARTAANFEFARNKGKSK